MKNHPSSFRELHEQLRAKKTLAMLALQEPRAAFWEKQEAVRDTLAAHQLVIHDRLAATLEKSIGVRPHLRERFREELERLVRAGHGSVDQILADVRSLDQVNGATTPGSS